MKIMEAINIIDALKPNGYTQPEKITWLSQLDGMIQRELIDTHVGGDAHYAPYNEDTDPETELLAPEPFCRDLYIKYLSAQMDFHNGEIEQYNNTLVSFQTDWTAFSRWYNRTHLPKSMARKYW